MSVLLRLALNIRRAMRRALCLTQLAIACACPALAAADASAPVPWTVSTPEAQGIDSAMLQAALDDIDARGIPFYSLLVFRHHKLVLESYRHPYRSDMTVDLRSATKSVLSAVVGIAIGEGALPGTQAPVLPYFPDHPASDADPRKSTLRIEHLLTMSSGLEWDRAQDVTRMFRSRDWVGFALDRPLAAAPGERFLYSEGDVHLLSAIVRRATGESARDYGRRKLFDPIGMTVEWASDPAGISIGGGGLRTTPLDMARLGHLYLQKGRWGDRQIIPEAWVEASTRYHRDSGNPLRPGYGYLWWRLPAGGFSAVGSGGKYIYVRPEDELVIVTTAGLNVDDIYGVLERDVMPAIRPVASLPAQADAAARLQARARQWQDPASQPVSVPPLAREISGQAYAMQRKGGTDTLPIMLSFDKADEATINYLNRELKVGLDGRFRVNPNTGVLCRGHWIAPDDFRIERILRDGAHGEIRMRFSEGTLNVSEVDTASGTVMLERTGSRATGG